MEKDKRLWTLKETSEYLGVTERTIFRLIKRGELPAVKIGKALRFRRPDLERFVAERLTSRGLVATKPFVFKETVLDKYRGAPEVYYLHDEGFGGRLGRRVDWFPPFTLPRRVPRSIKEKLQNITRRLVGKPPRPVRWASPPPPPKKDWPKGFRDVFYHKIHLKDKRVVVLVSAEEMAKILPQEQAHWWQFRITQPELLPWPWI